MLVSVAVWLFGVLDLAGMVSMLLLLSGLWTVVSALTIVEKSDRNYYLGWGAVIAILSLFNSIPFRYAIALVLTAIVILIIINVYFGRTPKMYEAATTQAPAGGGTPAATAI